MIDGLSISSEQSRWRARDIKFVSGNLDQIFEHIPLFEFGDFSAGDGAGVNPLYKSIVRIPMTEYERPFPVAIVSPSYSLVQHRELADICVNAMAESGIRTTEMRFEVGLSQYAELMVFRIYLPERFNFKGRDGHSMGLRIECINSVDGSYRMVVLFGWLRFVCLNGMVIGRTLTEIREIHSGEMDLRKIVQGLQEGLSIARRDSEILSDWENVFPSIKTLSDWTNEVLAPKWGVLAAMRVFHISNSGHDVKLKVPFAEGNSTEKPVEYLDPVPGAKKTYETAYDVLQAMTFVASQRSNFEERVRWQSEVSGLIDTLITRSKLWD